MNQQREMLITCRDQFARYAQNHRAKVGPWQNDLQHLDKTDEQQCKEYEAISLKIDQTIKKAETNERLVREIQSVIDAGGGDIIAQTANFADIAYADGISPKNQQSQIAVHFEEVGEMAAELFSNDPSVEFTIREAERALDRLADKLKNAEPCIEIRSRLNFLDACCDQLVTATLSAKLHGMDPVGGLNEVNRSNFSKLVGGVMQKHPVTAKWLKGPAYTKPDLKPFI